MMMSRVGKNDEIVVVQLEYKLGLANKMNFAMIFQQNDSSVKKGKGWNKKKREQKKNIGGV